MSQARFTEAADPAVEAAIAATLRRVTDAAGGIPGLEAVLLGGSLGRGEGTPGRDGTLASDVEIYLVGGERSLRTAAARLQHRMGDEPMTPSVSVAWLDVERLRRGWAKNLSRRPSRTIQLYELGAGTRVLSGSRPTIRAIDPATLPLAEGVRLLLNRFAEAAPLVAAGHPDGARWLDKLLIACGDTLLLARGAYTVSYRDRVTRLATLEEPWPMPDGWRDTVAAAYERKLRGAGGAAVEAVQVGQLAASTLREALRSALDLEIGSWHVFPAAYVARAAADERFLRYLPPIGPGALYEAVIVLVRARRSGLRLAPRAAVLAARGRPLSLALQAASAPLFLGLVEQRPELVAAGMEAMRAAGVPDAALRRTAGRPEALAVLLRRYWEAVA